jgi:hypothetical protein
MPIEEVVCYVPRDGPSAGAVFVSLDGDRRMIPDSWLLLAELTEDETMLTLHYSARSLSIRGHELRWFFDDAVQGVWRRSASAPVHLDPRGYG